MENREAIYINFLAVYFDHLQTFCELAIFFVIILENLSYL